MAEEVGVAYVRLVPSMRGFGPEAQRALTDATAEPAANAGQEAGGRFGEAFKAAMLGAGIVAGAALVGGVGEALDQSRITAKMGAQLGTTPAVAQRYGKIAGQLFSRGVTTDFESAAQAIQATMRAGLLPPDATNEQIESISTRLSDVATLMDEDVSQAARAVGKMMKTGLAKDAGEALDILTRGVQTGANEAEDLLDTFSEYSTQFRNMGFSGTQAMGLISQGLKAGARDADVVADTIKEFSIEAVAGGDRVKDGFKSLGLDADAMVQKFAKGGPTAAKAFDTVLDKLRGIENPAKRNAVAIELFGTKAEDMGQALFALDPSKATDALGKVAGAADKAGNTLRDNAGSRLQAFKNQLQQAFVETLGNKVIPKIDQFVGWMKRNEGPLKTTGQIILGVLVPALILMGIHATITAARTVTAWVTSGAAAVRSAATQAMAAGRVVASWVMMAGRAIAQAARIVGAWVATGARAAAGAAMQVAAGARVVATWAMMAARSLASAARMAASWLIAMGPVGIIIGIVIGLVALIVANWDKVKAFTAAAWDWIWGKIKAAAGFIMDAIGFLGRIPQKIKVWFGQAKAFAIERISALTIWMAGVPGRITKAISSLGSRLWSAAKSHFNRFKSGAIAMATSAINWVKGLPGRIGRAIGSLHTLLYNKGRDVIRGLWNGIKSMGSWLRSTLAGWAKRLIPGPIAKALGIGSPSKVMAEAVGRWIPAGIAEGWKAGLPALAQLATETMGTVVPQITPATATTSRAAAPAGTTVIIDGTGMPRALVEWLRGAIRTEGGGSVQVFLGQPGRG